MRKRPTAPRISPRLTRWEIIKLKASPARVLGHIFAVNEKAALKTGIEQFHVREVDWPRLMVRRV